MVLVSAQASAACSGVHDGEGQADGLGLLVCCNASYYGCGHHRSICSVTRRPPGSPTAFNSTPQSPVHSPRQEFPEPAI